MRRAIRRLLSESGIAVMLKVHKVSQIVAIVGRLGKLGRNSLTAVGCQTARQSFELQLLLRNGQRQDNPVREGATHVIPSATTHQNIQKRLWCIHALIISQSSLCGLPSIVPLIVTLDCFSHVRQLHVHAVQIAMVNNPSNQLVCDTPSAGRVVRSQHGMEPETKHVWDLTDCRLHLRDNCHEQAILHRVLMREQPTTQTRWAKHHST
jgi:hypothetical protein